MDFILGILVAPWVLWAVLAVCLLCDLSNNRYDDYSGWAAVWFIVLAIVGTARLLTVDIQITLPLVGGAVIGYLLIGAVWSLWRYRSMITKMIARINEQGYEPAIRTKLLQELKRSTRASNHVGFIVFHMVAFPISFVTNLFGDMYRLAAEFVRRYMVGIFNTVHAKLFKDIE